MKLWGFNDYLSDALCIRLQFSTSLEVIERIFGPYNDSRWPTTVSSQCCLSSHKVCFQYTVPRRTDGLVSHEREIEPLTLRARQSTSKH
ncbi:hypothetical protein KIN20_038459 [Parelaphostrongylus tenuis]|uniref:Uncharacterized protein n=1 Tax=Parelaphostrongylus tenuis TaxID=148309 RepID=A0AAD5RAV5_PARTN|nr:hypothetical protein KIN20_038459 [Parelaphostrongylus tenuis]